MEYYTWITKKDGKVNYLCQKDEDISPGSEWEKVANDWGGNEGDDLKWFDANMHRIEDEILVEMGLRKDNKGDYYNKHTGEAKTIRNLDEELDDNWTQEIPLNDPYQKWDESSGSWIVDTAEKEKTEKNSNIAKKKAAIEDAEKRIQRSTRAKLSGTATEEDEQFFNQISAEILSLRNELKQLTAA